MTFDPSQLDIGKMMETLSQDPSQLASIMASIGNDIEIPKVDIDFLPEEKKFTADCPCGAHFSVDQSGAYTQLPILLASHIVAEHRKEPTDA